MRSLRSVFGVSVFYDFNEVLGVSRVMMFRANVSFMILDAVIAIFSLWVGVSLKNETWFIVPLSAAPLVILAPVISVGILWRAGAYHMIDTHLHLKQLLSFSKAMGLYCAIFLVLCILLYPTGIPRSVGIIQPVLMLLGIVGLRLINAAWNEHVESKLADGVVRTPALIYGAGSAGRLLAVALKNSTFQVNAFLDDDPAKVNKTLEGIEVISRQSLEYAKLSGLEVVFLAMPALAGDRKEQIFDELSALGYRVITVPRLTDLALGSHRISDVRPLTLEDLLERDSVSPNPMLLQKNIKDQTVMVTGAGGSIGSELCRQILKQTPKRLILVDHSEFMLFQIDRELSETLADVSRPLPEIHTVLASVTHSLDMQWIFTKFQVHTVFHAAAYKHVHLLESNASQGLHNNVISTRNVVEQCQRTGVENMVLVSTDKAVRPTSVMGLSKRVAELVVQNAAVQSQKTVFSIVRFGNVLGSNGSVVPIFKSQIEKGGPVTVTDPEVTRYFMTISEAASLVIQAGALAQSGDVFVLDMGRPVKITSLAERLIKLQGGIATYQAPSKSNEIEIQFTGLKPGEKLHEELTLSEKMTPTLHPKILKVIEPSVDETALENTLKRLEASSQSEVDAVKYEILELVKQAML